MNNSRAPRRGTLAQLAVELGISRTTVSNAFNRPDQLSAELREKILKAAAARGYPGPDPTARSLRTRRIGAIGVLMTEHLAYAFEDLASVDFLAGLAESSYGTDNMLSLVPLGPEAEASGGLINRAVVDGFVVYSVAADDPIITAVRATGLPTIICDQPYDLPDYPYVGIDDDAGIRPAARALLDAGHYRIGILAKRLTRVRHDGPVSTEDIAHATLHVQRGRIQGALDEFRLAGLDPRSIPVVVRHHNDHASALEGARELLSRHPELTAVLCTTDSMAFGVLDYAREQGLRVPQDLSVTGFDGVGPALLQGLTTVVQPNKAKGAEAGALLDALIDARVGDQPLPEPTRTVLPTHLVRGSTVARPERSEP